MVLFSTLASRFERVEDGLIEELREMSNNSNNETNKNIKKREETFLIIVAL